MAHKGVEWIYNLCRLGGPQHFKAGDKSEVAHKWAGWLHDPCRVGVPQSFRSGDKMTGGPQVGRMPTSPLLSRAGPEPGCVSCCVLCCVVWCCVVLCCVLFCCIERHEQQNPPREYRISPWQEEGHTIQETLSGSVSLYPLSKSHNFFAKNATADPPWQNPHSQDIDIKRGKEVKLSCETSLFVVAPRTFGGGMATTWLLPLSHK